MSCPSDHGPIQPVPNVSGRWEADEIPAGNEEKIFVDKLNDGCQTDVQILEYFTWRR